MVRAQSSYKLLFVSLISLVFSSQSAFAVLGGKAATVSTTASTMKAKIKAASSSSSSYTAQDVVTEGTTVREYINSEGNIFAVAWAGVIEPDLSSLLGDYYTEYTAAVRVVKKTSITKRNLNVETTRVKVQKYGHMRSWHGLAYLPDQVPADVSIEDLSL